MSQPDAPGIYTYGPNDRPALIIIDKTKSVYETYYRYDNFHLLNICGTHQLNFLDVLELISGVRFQVHTVMIDLPTYLTAQKNAQ